MGMVGAQTDNANKRPALRVAYPALLIALAVAVGVVLWFSANSNLDDTLLTRTVPTAMKDGWYMDDDGEPVELSEVSRVAANNIDGILKLTHKLPDVISDETALCFQTKNESVRVWVDASPVYMYGKEEQRVYGHGVGAVWHIAHIPDGSDGKTVTVELIPIGGRTGLAPYEFTLGNSGDIISMLLWNNSTIILVSVLLALTGLGAFALFVLWASKHDSRAPSALHFSLFVIISTVWMVADSGLLQFLIRDKGVIYLIFGSSFYLSAAPIALFMSSMQPEYKKVYNALSAVSSAYAILRIGLFAAGVLDFEYALWVLHLIMAVIIVTANVTLRRARIQKKHRQMPELFTAVIVFMVVEGVSLISFYAKDKLDMLRNGYSSGFYTGILLFVFIVAIGQARHSQNIRKQAFKAAFLERRAYTDELTGLLNVKGFDDKCAEKLSAASGDRCCAIVDFDVNFFSQYNATNGLDAGDALLKRIGSVLSEFCCDDELCARQEADHFVCLLRGESMDAILERIRKADAAARDRIAENMLLISYGAVEVTDGNLSIPALRNQAAVAKRTIKGNYENNIAVYDHDLHEQQIREVIWLSGFESSLKNREYVIFLQPKIEIATGHVGGAEALVRRVEADGSVVSAGPIIEALEQKGFVTKLDFYVMELVCELLARCIKEGRDVYPVSSNFSRVHTFDNEFASKLSQIADKHGVPHRLVEIELTETAFLVGKDALQNTVRSLHEHGFPVAIDDFGSGYSSLNMLKDVDVDVIKLDREFLEGFAENRRADTVIEHTMHLANAMNIVSVAEGIETEEQLEFLKSLGCTYVQGYFYSRPIPEAEYVEKYMLKKSVDSIA